MTQNSLTVRLYEREDEKDYLKLMNTVFPSYKCDLKRWQWEFKENPFGFLQVFGISEGKLVGTMGLIGVPVKIKGVIFQASQAVDLAVHPEFRGKGLFIKIGKKLMQEADNKGFTLSYGVPNEPAYHGHLKYGWFYVSEIPVLTKMLSKKALMLFTLARFRDLFSHHNLRSVSNIKTLIRNFNSNTRTLVKCPRPLRSDKFTKRILTSFNEQFDRLWNEASTHHELLVVRDRRYLNWRYVKKPHANYVILAAERNKTIDGYAVLATEIRSFAGWKKGYIIDIFAKSKEAIEFLIQMACDYFSDENADLAICWMMKNQEYYDRLVKHGFVNDTFSSQKLICRVNTSDNTFKRLFRILERNWFFTMGDSDYI
jgi:GNAT superfamily N-acetyltransferase